MHLDPKNKYKTSWRILLPSLEARPQATILTENESQAEAAPSQMNQAAKPAKTAKTSGPGHPNPTKGQTRSRRLKQPR